jgi:hypothetical protein
MVSRLFQANHDNAEDIIGVVCLAGYAMGKGGTSWLHKVLAATHIEKLSNTRIQIPSGQSPHRFTGRGPGSASAHLCSFLAFHSPIP